FERQAHKKTVAWKDQCDACRQDSGEWQKASVTVIDT
ncbi:MAG: hypothetical protein ACI9HU_000707, partial [Colwellia sp.]